jgi:hypothetical protein
MFYDANGYRLGSGIVQSVNTSTGEVTLMSGTDNYTAKSGQTKLTAAETVLFSAVVSVSFGTVMNSNFSDCTMISPPAILVEGRTKRITDCYIADFHCAIVYQNDALSYDNIWTNNCAMAGIATRNLGSGADQCSHNVFIQGGTFDDLGQSASSVAVAEQFGKSALCAMWGIPTKSVLGDLVSDEHYHGVIDCYGGEGAEIGYLLVDKPLKEAFISFGGIYNGGRGNPVVHIGAMNVCTVGQSVITPAGQTYPSGKRSAIALMGAAGRIVQADVVTVQRFNSNTSGVDDLDSVTNIVTASQGTNMIYLGNAPHHQAALAISEGVAPKQLTWA